MNNPPYTQGSQCDVCGGSLQLPHPTPSECCAALSAELVVLRKRERQLSIALWRLGGVDRREPRGEPPSTQADQKKLNDES